MGISQHTQKIKPIARRAAAATAAASLFLGAFAAGKSAEPEPTPTPTPEPTEVPRPDHMNIKKPSTSDALLAQDWLRLSLLKASDLPGLKQTPELGDKALRRRISESFGLPAIMTMRDPARDPPQWWTPETKGTEALNLGPTRHFERPELKIEFPMLRLREVPYLNGESEFVRSMNEVVRLWTQGRTAEAAKLRDKLQKDKKKVPRGTLERTAVAILNGFLDLQLAIEAEEPLSFYGPASGSMWDALGSTETKIFLNPEGKNKIESQLFDSALAEPAMFTNAGVWPPMLAPPKLSARSMDLIPFVRTLALPAIVNVAALSAKAKNWTRVFETSDKFNAIYSLLDKSVTNREGRSLLFTTPSGVAVTHSMLMRPQTVHHLQILMKMLRVKAQFRAEDPLQALVETARVILSSEVPAFRTIGFSLAGNIYDDLGYPNYARRFYAFAEAYADIEWYQQNPYFLLGGAESAFWTGDYDIARRAFEKFLLAAGDKTYGPWARLRLAEITQLKQGTDKAAPLYESLFRSQPNHPAGLIARRRLFCINSAATGARARHLEYQSLKDMVTQFDVAEMEQIRACHITGLVDDVAKMSSGNVKLLPDEAALQLSLIDEFKQKYPESSYQNFFETRAQTLQAAKGPFHLAFKQCSSALEFVRQNEAKISTLKKNSGRFLDTLRWTQDEQERLIRCAALFSSSETLEKIQKEQEKRTDRGRQSKNKKAGRKATQNARTGESPDQRLVRLTLSMTIRPTDKTAADLLNELRRRGRFTLGEDVKTLEERQSESIDDPEFWVKLAKLKVLGWDLEQPAAKKKQLNRQLRAEVLRQPHQTLKNDEFCHRFMLESATLTRKEWDAFVLALPTSRWLEISGVSAAPAAESECAKRMAVEALRTAQSLPTLARDRHLLWPWLKARGAQQEQEAWLALGQRWDQQGSVSKQELETLFKTLEKEADNPLVRQAAKAWIESRKPPGLW